MLKFIKYCGCLSLLAGFATTSYAAGMSDDDARALSADLLLIKFEVGIETCADLGARNMQALYGAYRSLQNLRAELAPVAEGKSINQAKVSYKQGLSALPKPDLTKEDHIEVLCDRTLEKMVGISPDSFTRMVNSTARTYQQMFAQAK